ncbi:MAG: hypothetical protein ABIP93_09015 [Gemmatimonadaceae bacterium]
MFFTTLRARYARSARWSALAAIAGVALVAGAARPWVNTAASIFGGPWISIESPVNPYDASTRGALFVVHTFRHGNPMDMGMTGKAEGLVDGQRRSVSFRVDKATSAGTYAVRRQWADKGIWTLVITATATDHGPGEQLQAVVEIGADGEMGKVSVPRNERGAFRMVASAEIERSLKERAKLPVAVGSR